MLQFETKSGTIQLYDSSEGNTDIGDSVVIFKGFNVFKAPIEARRNSLLFAACIAWTFILSPDAKTAQKLHQKSKIPANYRQYYQQHKGNIDVYYDTIAPNGQFQGGKAKIILPNPKEDSSDLVSTKAGAQGPIWNLTTLRNNGPVDNRVDWVIVGDGYTQSQLNTYADHVQKIVDGWFAADPFYEYADYFNVHRVEVISSQSGIDDHEANPQVYVDTALDMYHSGRMVLIGDMQAVWDAIACAPDFDTGTALSNTTIYGGAGHPAIAASSGGNHYSIGLVLHEMGHSFGRLADEYYTAGETYTDNEPSSPNVSIYTAAEMFSQRLCSLCISMAETRL